MSSPFHQFSYTFSFSISSLITVVFYLVICIWLWTYRYSDWPQCTVCSLFRSFLCGDCFPCFFFSSSIFHLLMLLRCIFALFMSSSLLILQFLSRSLYFRCSLMWFQKENFCRNVKDLDSHFQIMFACVFQLALFDKPITNQKCMSKSIL